MRKYLITLGDPNGIGSEITAKALSECFYPEQYEVIGIPYSWDPYSNLLPDIKLHDIKSDYRPEYGKLSAKAGYLAIQTLDKAISLLKTNKYQGLITAPLCKKAVSLAGYNTFRGHTEYLAQAFRCKTEMVFWSPKWSVLLMTTHTALSSAIKMISSERFREALSQAIKFHKQHYSDGFVTVCGLNPHAGENGLMGTEEEQIFLPIIEEFQKKGEPVLGVFSPDTLFITAEKAPYSTTVLAPTHDIALIPFKLLHFHDGVHVTTGLPYPRTSPDHGTAFDIAEKNKANHQAMIAAINFITKNT